MNVTSYILHPSFTLNGLQFETEQELLQFAEKLTTEGDDYEIEIGVFIRQWLQEETTITVKTSGSTGSPKKIKIAKKHMINSAKATGTYLELPKGTEALLCLPANYIAGKMMLVRAMVLGWNLHVVAPEKDALSQYDNDYDFVAMVPYQAFHSLDVLHKVKKLIIGGGAVSEDLENALQALPTEAYSTYGMTETISHIAMRRLNGKDRSKAYHALPNVTFSEDDRGCLVIKADKISEEIVVTNDTVQLLSSTSFVWLGRYDNVINSGGVKIHPEVVEDKLRSEIQFPFLIASEKDEALGEKVILVLENKEALKIPNYTEAFQKLSQYERPKKIYTLSQFPYTETGKIKRGDVLQILKKYK
ncbi:AMP-binding protein [Cochleicola gelatinilyticus]|uniref:AMP-dependent synthetase/ligase domain-containing protein n=1 Tax=Cochleicola gelatinilyticus TaxID=1763537 RepID=A0A167HHT7_9FLAO|nr:AMP-binding protein [Cochleicola gelatinilyticus]OAB78619.1 hypothetical protein ULVI_08510 [Cochleicola gelatinilyticus]